MEGEVKEGFLEEVTVGQASSHTGLPPPPSRDV